MKPFRFCLVSLCATVATGQTAADKITAGRAALATRDLPAAQARFHFQEALTLNPIAQTAAALLGITRLAQIERAVTAAVAWDHSGHNVTLAPMIAAAPQDRAVGPGAATAFAVTATGAPPLSDQWRKDGVARAGATTATLSLAGVQPAGAGNYSALVSNPYGSATTAPATLAVDSTITPLTNAEGLPGLADALNGQRLFSITVPAGQTQLAIGLGGGTGDADLYVKFAATPTRTSFDYRPFLAGNAESVVIDHPAAGEWCILLFGQAGYADATLTATFTALPVAPALVAQPQPLAVAAGQSASFTVMATGTPPIGYQWRKGGVAIGGATAATYPIANVGAGHAGSYDVVVSNPAGRTTSSAALLTVTAPVLPPVVTSPPAARTAPEGSPVTLAVGVSGTAPFGFQWRKDGVPIAGATAGTFSFASVQATNAGSYSVTVTNGAGTATYGSAQLTVVAAGPAPSNDHFANAQILTGDAGTVFGDNAGAARFSNVRGLVTDPAGNLFLADTPNHTIRKISPAGVTSTLAGLAGTAGSADGAGSAARFNTPQGLTIDNAGNILVADTFNHTIRKITPGGVVSTVAGLAGTFGSADGAVAVVRFQSPLDVALDTAGNLYVADLGNYTIRKISTAGVVSTLAGLAGISGTTDGTGAAARFNSPYAVAVDSAGHVFVAENNSHTIRKVTPAGVVTTFAGLAGTRGNLNGAGTAAQFSFPADLLLDGAGNLLVADSGNSAIRTITPAGVTGPFATGVAVTALTLDGAGNIYAGSSRIVSKVDATGASRLFAGLPNVTGSTDGPIAATGEPGEPTHVTTAGTASSLWYAWTPSRSGPATIDTNGSGFDTVLAVYTGSTLGTLGSVAQDDDGGVNHASRVTISVSAGVTYRIAVASYGTSRGSVTLTCTVLAAPAIEFQPASQTPPAGGAATFSVIASGGALAYQWHRNGTELTGATSATLIVPNVRAADAGGYSVTVSNLLGRLTSNVATLNLGAALAGVVAAWGSDLSGQITGTAGTAFPYTAVAYPVQVGDQTLADVISCSAGGTHTLALRSDGTVTGWGANTDGQLTFPGGLVGVSAIAAGGAHSLALRSDGTVIAWGSNAAGQLNVPVGLSGATAIAAGSSHSLALKSDGTVLAWGVGASNTGSYPFYGQAIVPAGLANVRGIAAGPLHCLVVKNDGTVVAWGYNYYGQTVVPAGLTGVIAVAGGHSHSMALKNDGTVVTWGDTHSLGPITPPAGLTGVVAIAAGYYHSLALKNDGAVVGWGYTANDRTTPPAGLAPAFGISGASHSVALVLPAPAAPPGIGVQPAGMTVAVGGAANFSVTASGPGLLTYQWIKNRAAIPGTTAATLVLAGVQLSDAGTYAVAVTNAAGSVTSTLADLIVNFPPTILSQPVSQTVAAGQPAVFMVTAAAQPDPAFQWRRQGAAIAGATAPTLLLAGTQPADAGIYDVVVTNPLGAVTSAAVSLTVNTPPVIVLGPATRTVAAGQPTTWFVLVTGVPSPSFQWSKDGAPLSGATAANYAIASVASADAGNYTVTVTNALGSATSAAAALTVTVAPVITAQPVAVTVAAGGSASFSVGATGTPAPVYQWRKNGVPLTGATAATLALTAVQPADAGAYAVSVSNAAGSVVSAAAVLTINVAGGAPFIIVQPADQLATAGQSVTFTVAAVGDAPLAYQWRKHGANIAAGTGASFTLSAAQPADAGVYSAVVSNAAGGVTSRDALLSIIPAGFTAAQTAAGNRYLAGRAAQLTTTLTFTGTLSRLDYQLLLPAGFSYGGASGAEGDLKPALGTVDLLAWTWPTPPASPVTFTVLLQVAAGVVGPQSFTGLVTAQPGTIRFLAQPDPLVLNAFAAHSADTMGATAGSLPDGRINLAELTRLIELYNWRTGTVRTGQYTILAGTEDGFTPGPDGLALTRLYHTADTSGATPGPAPDGRISLAELLRVIELYNYRSGTVRLGQYHVQPDTEDGFAPGP